MPDLGSSRFVPIIESYREQIGTINMEAAKASRFATLLDDLFGDTSMKRSMLAEYLRNTEKSIKTEGAMIIRGRMDALFGNAIIEFEHELNRAHFEEAEEQLRRYAGILR
jgi:hypothetical protein